jgi:hypothetical protein
VERTHLEIASDITLALLVPDFNVSTSRHYQSHEVESHIDGFIQEVDAAKARMEEIKSLIDPVVAAKEEAKKKQTRRLKQPEILCVEDAETITDQRRQ